MTPVSFGGPGAKIWQGLFWQLVFSDRCCCGEVALV